MLIYKGEVWWKHSRGSNTKWKSFCSVGDWSMSDWTMKNIEHMKMIGAILWAISITSPAFTPFVRSVSEPGPAPRLFPLMLDPQKKKILTDKCLINAC